MSDIRHLAPFAGALPRELSYELPLGSSVEETRSRRGHELEQVALGPLPAEERDAVIYWMFNGVTLAGDDRPPSRLRYELTSFTGRGLGPESPRTLGHRHAPGDGDHVGRPEICQVVEGGGMFVFFDVGWFDTESATASTYVTVPVVKADTVVIPPGIDHCVISSWKAPMTFADLIARDVSIVADPVRRAGGPPWFALRDGRFVRNPRYRTHPPITTMSPATWNGDGPMDRRLPVGVSLHDHHRWDPAAYGWLTDAAAFMRLFPELWERTGSRVTRAAGGSR